MDLPESCAAVFIWPCAGLQASIHRSIAEAQFPAASATTSGNSLRSVRELRAISFYGLEYHPSQQRIYFPPRADVGPSPTRISACWANTEAA